MLGVKSSETVLARTDTKEIEVFDLEDNDYNFVVTPLKDGKKGETSPEAGVKVKNTWNAETSLKTTQVGKNQVKLEWNAAIGVENYRIRVYEGDSKSLLQIVNMDYKEQENITVPVTGEKLEYVYTYIGDV